MFNKEGVNENGDICQQMYKWISTCYGGSMIVPAVYVDHSFREFQYGRLLQVCPAAFEAQLSFGV